MTAWVYSHRYDRAALPLADRHYNRRKPGSPQFVPPGRNVVFLTDDARALWVTSWPFGEYVRHRWPGAWVNSLFRNEGTIQSSALILDALAATRAAFGPPPSIESWIVERRTPHVTWIRRGFIALVTFIDPRKTRRKRDPGRCYRRAGFVDVGETRKERLVALAIETHAVPIARPARRSA